VIYIFLGITSWFRIKSNTTFYIHNTIYFIKILIKSFIYTIFNNFILLLIYYFYIVIQYLLCHWAICQTLYLYSITFIKLLSQQVRVLNNNFDKHISMGSSNLLSIYSEIFLALLYQELICEYNLVCWFNHQSTSKLLVLWHLSIYFYINSPICYEYKTKFSLVFIKSTQSTRCS
jgi:hypothetical protein